MPDISIKAHCDGFTQSVYDYESECVVSAGADKFIEVWSYPDCEQMISHTIDKPISGMKYENERIYVCSESNKIELFSTVTQIPPTIVTEFTANVNDINLSQDKTKLIACSDDHIVRLIDIVTKKDTDFKHNKSPVMSCAINCTNSLLASASCDGFVILIDIESKAIKNKWKLLLERKTVLKNEKCRLLFSPVDKKLLAIPLNDSIDFYNCLSGRLNFSLKFSSITKGRVTSCIFSKSGTLFSGGFSDGYIIIWNLETKKVMYKNKSSREGAIQSMEWLPTSELSLLFADSTGYWESTKVLLVEEEEDDLNDAEEDNDELTEDQFNNLFEGIDNDDVVFDDEAKEVDKDKNKNQDEDTDYDGDDADTVVSSESKDQSDNEDKGEFDIELSQIKKQYEPIDIDFGDQKTEQIIVPETRIIKEERKPHEPIRPGSASRVKGMELLLWNPLVVVKKYFDETKEEMGLSDDVDSVNEYTEIDFQDKGAGRNLILPHSVIEYHMIDVNYAAIMLVSVKDENSDYGARIDVRPLSGASTQYWLEWTQYLPDKERPVSCALVSDMYAVTLSDNGLLRWFSLSCGGELLDIESIPGHPVCLSGTGPYSAYDSSSVDSSPDRSLLIVSDLEGIGGGLHCRWDRIAKYGSLDSSGSRRRIKLIESSDWMHLPISKGATLTWIGYSNTGVIYSVDSRHQVRKLSSGKRWRPVLDLRSSLPKSRRSTDRHFPIGVMDKYQGDSDTIPVGVMSVLCTGTRSPRLVPLPHLTVVPFSIPMCPETSDISHNILKNQIIFDWTVEDNKSELILQEKKMLLNLFMISLSKNEDNRAYGIACLMPDSQIIQTAIHCAVKVKKKVLATKLGDLALQIDQEAQEEPEEEEQSIEMKEVETNIETYSDFQSGADTQLDDDYKENEDQSAAMNYGGKTGASQMLNNFMSTINKGVHDDSDNEAEAVEEDSQTLDTQEKLKADRDVKSPFVTNKKPLTGLNSRQNGVKYLNDLITENEPGNFTKKSSNNQVEFGKFKPNTNITNIVPPNKKTFVIKSRQPSIRKLSTTKETGEPVNKMSKN